MARLRIYGSATCCMFSAVCTRTVRPSCSSASATASAFIVVASMPIWSARVRSISPEERPRQKLPPPTTMAICAPISCAFWMPRQMLWVVSVSMPKPRSPARASPLSLSRTR